MADVGADDLGVDGLAHRRIERDGVGIATWSGGSGDTVVLLHGYPQTSHMWRHLVPALLEDHHVVLADLRGYGASDAPEPGPGDASYAKREMAADVALVLDTLGVDSAHLVGHDRGGRVVHRFCLDFPELVRTAAVLDIVPSLHMFEHVDRAMAEAYFHWFFLARGGGLPETLLRADPDTWIRSRFAGRHRDGFVFEESAVQAYADAFRRPGVVEATCADYRAAAGIDLEHDRADREAGRTVQSPLLVGWGTSGYVGRSFAVPEVWSGFAADVHPAPIEADHYVAEENPAATLAALDDFWTVTR
ncbi:alpha/beta fold hydrolase [Nocardioides hwasunensis]|uniref:Alpha/beta hydrolase n=1 Tax=Nocardioides hwasunensis TaxID=397258 RepID=A0ABR8MJY3_9ACTN|nr:alpha/beta hydrolase [Nocardioides hwasunensis]MBD3916340.1 alpha/beta hydrolase [Nocardioides hwasunensis]